MGRYKTKLQAIQEANKRILKEVSKEYMSTFFPDEEGNNNFEDISIKGKIESKEGKRGREIIINDDVIVKPGEGESFGGVEGCIGKESTIYGYKSIFLSSPHIFAQKVECE